LACALICKNYGYTLEQVKDLTLMEFNMLIDSLVKIIELENPTPDSEKAKPLSANSLGSLVKGKKKKTKRPKGKK